MEEPERQIAVDPVVLGIVDRIRKEGGEPIVQERSSHRLAHRPELLSAPDVAEVPTDGTVEVVDAHPQELVRDAVEEPEGAGAHVFERLADLGFAGGHGNFTPKACSRR